MPGKDSSTCPKCGAKIYVSDTECMSCGAELDHGRLVESEQPIRPGLHIEHGIAELRVGEVEYRTVPDATLDWGALAGGGLLDALVRSWRFFGACMRMIVDYPVMVLPSFFTLAATVGLLGAIWAALHFMGLEDVILDSDKGKGNSFWFWALSVPVSLVLYAVIFTFMGMTVHMVDAYLRGRRATVRQAVADVIKNFRALFYLAVVNTVVSLLLSAARSRTQRSWAGRAAVDAADRVRDVANYLVVPVIIIEDKPMGQALRRAYALFSRSIMDIVIAELGLLILNRVIGVIAVVLGIGAIVAAQLLAPKAFPLAVAGVVVAAVFAAVITSFIRTAYYTCLYLWAAAMEALGTENVPAPAPIARALAPA